MRDLACMWFIVKKAKIFWSYVKNFWILESARKWLVYANKLFWIVHPYLSSDM